MLDQVKNFLPQMARANQVLIERIAEEGRESVHIECDSQEQNNGLGQHNHKLIEMVTSTHTHTHTRGGYCNL